MTRRASTFALSLALPLALFIVWWLASIGSTSPFYPPLTKILETFQQVWLFQHFMSDLVPSLIRILAGLAISIVLGIGFGVLIGASPGLRKTVEPTLDFVRAIPAAAILPVAIIVLGISDSQKIFIIVFGAVWPILLNTIDGVNGIDSTYHDFSRVYALRRRDRIFKVMIPAAAPQVFAGLRIALSTAILLVVYAEMFASTNGVGYFVVSTQALFQIPEMWAGVFMLSIIAFAANLIFVAIEQRMLHWHRGWKASQLGEPTDPPRGGGRRRWSIGGAK